jgi:hypothetical protein
MAGLLFVWFDVNAVGHFNRTARTLLLPSDFTPKGQGTFPQNKAQAFYLPMAAIRKEE